MTISRSDILTKEFLEECFVADFETGTLTWKARPRYHFPTERGWKIFNAQFAGKCALNMIEKRGDYKLYVCQILGTRVQAHHIIWTMYYGEMFNKEKYLIDHKDRNPLNNAVANLRLADYADNSRNTSIDRGKLSYDKVRDRWVVRSKFRCGTNVRGRFSNEGFAKEFLKYTDVLNRGEYSDFYPYHYSGDKFDDEVGFTPSVLKLLLSTNPPESDFLTYLRYLSTKNRHFVSSDVRGFGETRISGESFELLKRASLVRMWNDAGCWKILVKDGEEWKVVQREIGGDCSYKDRQGAKFLVERCNSDITIEKFWNVKKLNKGN